MAPRQTHSGMRTAGEDENPEKLTNETRTKLNRTREVDVGAEEVLCQSDAAGVTANVEYAMSTDWVHLHTACQYLILEPFTVRVKWELGRLQVSIEIKKYQNHLLFIENDGGWWSYHYFYHTVLFRHPPYALPCSCSHSVFPCEILLLRKSMEHNRFQIYVFDWRWLLDCAGEFYIHVVYIVARAALNVRHYQK